jgi:hypothetical protein
MPKKSNVEKYPIPRVDGRHFSDKPPDNAPDLHAAIRQLQVQQTKNSHNIRSLRDLTSRLDANMTTLDVTTSTLLHNMNAKLDRLLELVELRWPSEPRLPAVTDVLPAVAIVPSVNLPQFDDVPDLEAEDLEPTPRDPVLNLMYCTAPSYAPQHNVVQLPPTPTNLRPSSVHVYIDDILVFDRDSPRRAEVSTLIAQLLHEGTIVPASPTRIKPPDLACISPYAPWHNTVVESHDTGINAVRSFSDLHQG